MSDSGLTTDTAPAVPSDGGGQPAPPPSPPSAGDPDPLGELPADRAVFDRGYVERIRTEAAKYRTEASTAHESLGRYENVFGQYAPEDQAVWLDLARTWATDPSRAAAVMQQIASSVLGDMTTSTPPANPADPPVTSYEELTPEKVKELVNEGLAERDAAAASQKAVDDVFAEVRAGGFDPETAEGFMVLYNANHFTGGDIAKAIEMTNSYKQTIIDNYVQGRTTSAAMPAPSGSAATSAPAEIKNLDDSHRAATAWLKERTGG